MNLKYIELHLHLDGAVRISTLYDIALRKKIKLAKDVKCLTSFANYVSVGKKKSFASLSDCLSIFNQILSIISGNKNDLKRIVFELCEDQYNSGILYTEVRYNPHILMGDNLTLEEVVESINEGIKLGISKYPIYVNSLLCCLRSQPQWSKNIVNLAIKYRYDGVVGIDIAGDEYNHTDKLHREAFKLAKDNNLNITVHAGEAGGYENIISAIDNLYAKRIGHGYASINDSKLRKYLKENNIHLECCPTSSLQTKCVKNINEHPIKTFQKEGINFSINTDDPSIFKIKYQDEINLVKKHFGFTEEIIKKIMSNTLNSAFINTKNKYKIQKILNNNW